MIKHIIAAGIIALSGTAAQAASVTFDYTGSGGGAAPADQTLNGITASVSGLSCGASGCYAVGVQQWRTGLGIRTGFHDSHQVDGKGRDEAVVFSFSEAVRIVAATFSYVDPNDDVTLLTFGGAAPVSAEKGRIGLDGAFSGWSGAGSDTGSYTFAGLFEGDTFGFAAVDTYDNWKLSSITVSSIAPVPLPAAGWMLLAGLGGLVAMRRRR